MWRRRRKKYDNRRIDEEFARLVADLDTPALDTAPRSPRDYTLAEPDDEPHAPAAAPLSRAARVGILAVVVVLILPLTWYATGHSTPAWVGIIWILALLALLGLAVRRASATHTDGDDDGAIL